MKTILVIEDELYLSEAIKFKLDGRGFKTIIAGTAEEGLEFLLSKEIHLIWLDLRLPKMDGIKFLEKIRNNEKLKDKKVVVVSVSADVEKQERAKELGVLDYILKSDLQLEEIIDKIEKKM